MPSLCVFHYSDPSAFSLGLERLAQRGLTPRGLVFLALDPMGPVYMAVPERLEDLSEFRVGVKDGLSWPLEGRYYHFDSVHRLRPGRYLFNGDRRLSHPGSAEDVAGAVTTFLKGAGDASVFFGCNAHQPGSWVVSRGGAEPLHDSGFVEALPVLSGLLARRIMDDQLWLLHVEDPLQNFRPVYQSPLGNILMLERRISDGRLVLACARGLVEVDVTNLSSVTECDRVPMAPGFAVVGRIESEAFAVTQGVPMPWGLDEIRPAVLVGAKGGSLAALAKALGR